MANLKIKNNGSFSEISQGANTAIVVNETGGVEIPGLDLKSDLASTEAGKGAALVGFKQNGTGAIARTTQDKGTDVVTFEDFGAVGDGVTDDYESLQKAINSGVFVQGRDGSIYKSSSKLTITNKNFRLINSKFLFTSNDGIEYTSNDPNHTLLIDNVQVISDSMSSGKAISASWSVTGGYASRSCTLQNIVISGLSGTKYWKTGISITSGYNSVVKNCNITNNSDISNMEYGVRVSGPSIGVTIDNCFIYKANCAVCFENGLYNGKIINCDFNYVNIGVDFNYNSSMYGAILSVLDSKIFSLSYGINGKAVIALTVKNCFFQKAWSGNWVGVCLDQGTGTDVFESMIVNNQFGNQYGEVNSPGGPWVGIKVLNGRVLTISENMFDSGSGVCIDLSASATENIVKDNTLMQAITFIINTNPTNQIRNNYNLQYYKNVQVVNAALSTPNLNNDLGNYNDGYIRIENSSGGPVNVTGFYGGFFWQKIYVEVNDSAITFVHNTMANGSKLHLKNEVDYSPKVGDILCFMAIPDTNKSDIVWREISREV